MKPYINGTSFGSITIDDEVINHDVVIRLSGEVKKRKKKLSKMIYGSSHTISYDEAKFVYEKGAEYVIIGAGQSGLVTLSKEAKDYFGKKKCEVILTPTPEAIQHWNKTKGPKIGIFHITC
jgi:hypothetical protein